MKPTMLIPLSVAALTAFAAIGAATADDSPTLIFADDFERNESQEVSDEIGNGWGSNSKTRAKGHKQVDLKDGAMYIFVHEEADHAVSVTHPAGFRNGCVTLKFKLEDSKDSLGLNFADLNFKEVHAGHLCVVRISTSDVLLEDLKTGKMSGKIYELRKTQKLPRELQEGLKAKSKKIPHKLATGKWYDLDVTIRGETLAVSIDGEEVGSFSSAGIAHPTKRTLRLSVPKNAVVDDVKIYSLPDSVSPKNPNIVFILADDQGFGDVSALNPESKIPTPNIDRIANEGMIFSDGHSSSSVCTPTRYSVLTGRYHWRTHLQKGVLGGFSKPLISPGRLTVASLLKQQGYATACIGKWHLGWDWPLKQGGTADDEGDFSGRFAQGWDVDYTGEIQNGPCDLGFDRFFGISASLDMPPYVYVRDRTPTEPATVEKAFHRKGPAAAGFEAVDVLPTLTKEAVQFIGQEAKSDRPFFLYFPLNAPHTPIVPTGEWQGKSGINKYGDFTMQVDWTVGQVLQAIDDNGIADNTLVIFTTDNGCSPAANIPELEAAGHDQNYIYRGHKADIFEGGHRVPFVARWPGKVKAGSRSDQLVGQLDLLATAAEIVGAQVGERGGEDSVSFLPVLLGNATEPIRTSIVSQSIGGQFAIRDGTWKLCLCPGSGGWSAPRPGRSDLTAMPPVQLFNLADDPGETNNLQAEHPDRVAKMKEMLRRIIQRGRSTPGPRLENDAEIVMIKPVAKPAAKPKTR